MNKDKHTKQENYKTDADFPVREFLPDCAKEGKYKKKSNKRQEKRHVGVRLYSRLPLFLSFSLPLFLFSLTALQDCCSLDMRDGCILRVSRSRLT